MTPPKTKPGDAVIARLYPAAPWDEILAALRQETGEEWSRKAVQGRASKLEVARKVRYTRHPVLDESEAIVREMYPAGDLREIAARLTGETSRTWVVKDVHAVAYRLGLRRLVDQRMFPPALGRIRTPKTVSASRMVICSDIHVPFHDRDLLADMLRVARRDQCDTIIIAGDLVDAAAFSRWDRETPVLDWEKEVDAANSILYEIALTFEHVHILPGNHSYRVLKQTMGQMTWGNVMAGWEIMDVLPETSRPQVQDIPVLFLDTWGLVCHPDNYSRVPGNVAAALAAVHQRSVFAGHEHAMSLRLDVSGKHLCVGLGCMLRPEMVDYKTMHVTTHPAWTAGFWTVIDREPRPYVKGWYKV